MPIRQTSPLRILESKPFLLFAQLHFPIQLIKDSMGRLRQHRRNQNRDNSQRLGEIWGAQAARLLVSAARRNELPEMFSKFATASRPFGYRSGQAVRSPDLLLNPRE
jgi:hypothetical protein